MISRRLSHRLSRHHFPIGLATLASGYLLYVTRSFPDVLTRLSFSSAYLALVLLAAPLLIGPLKVLAGDRLAVSIDFRRDIGIWAGIVGLFHVAVGQCVHLRGRPWLYYIYENWRQKHILPMRHDLFGLANYTGIFAAFVLLALLATSNDAALRKLSTPGWKQLQRWNYVCFGLTAIHTLTYQTGIESQTFGFVAIAVLCILMTGILQFVGLRSHRYAQAKNKTASLLIG